MARPTAVWYRVGKDPDGEFEKDILDLCWKVKHPAPEIHGSRVNKGGEKTWAISVAIPSSKENPRHEDFAYGFLEKTWDEGLIRALQDVLARLCLTHQEELKVTYFYHLGRRNKEGVPVASNATGPYARHIGNVEAYLFTTQESLDRARERLDTRTN